jgi:hypothetical protein
VGGGRDAIVAQEIGGALIGHAAVEIVGIERDERSVDAVGGGQHRRHRAARDVGPHRLIGELHVETVAMAVGDRFDSRRQLVANHQHGAVEAGTAGVHQQVVDQGLAGGAHRFELFGPAESGAHTGGHHDNRQRHGNEDEPDTEIW